MCFDHIVHVKSWFSGLYTTLDALFDLHVSTFPTCLMKFVKMCQVIQVFSFEMFEES
jgi:hypothetical protein